VGSINSYSLLFQKYLIKDNLSVFSESEKLKTSFKTRF